MTTTPQSAAQRSCELPHVSGERFAGYAVIGAPFASGHYLALRRFPANSIGDGYTSVWHRDPDGAWTVYSDVPPELNCPRFLGHALSRTEQTDVRAEWTGPAELHVTAGSELEWDLRMTTSPATTVMNVAGKLMPDALWHSPAVLSAMGRVAGPMLGVGKVRLGGHVPNGQWFRANPRQLWTAHTVRAVVGGSDLGPDGPLAEQAAFGDFWLPQRALFATVQAWFEPFDAGRHFAARPEAGHAVGN
ncbi:hypothetical protein [Rhodococcus phenolicus]|uniref:hypothetical protein n=1 Tax=Rhodococcus phenolicus TaxID=263849 RepID=UPI000831F289|nr:hypothetical protein [Rhodococcus phenolicus]